MTTTSGADWGPASRAAAGARRRAAVVFDAGFDAAVFDAVFAAVFDAVLAAVVFVFVTPRLGFGGMTAGDDTTCRQKKEGLKRETPPGQHDNERAGQNSMANARSRARTAHKTARARASAASFPRPGDVREYPGGSQILVLGRAIKFLGDKKVQVELRSGHPASLGETVTARLMRGKSSGGRSSVRPGSRLVLAFDGDEPTPARQDVIYDVVYVSPYNTEVDYSPLDAYDEIPARRGGAGSVDGAIDDDHLIVFDLGSENSEGTGDGGSGSGSGSGSDSDIDIDAI